MIAHVKGALRRAWTGVLVLAAVAASWHPNVENDIFFHLYLGRAVLKYRARVVPEPTAFSDFDPTCIVPAWLWDVLVFKVHELGGFVALGLMTALTAALGAIAIAYLCERCLDDERALLPFVVVSGAMTVCAMMRYQIRPQTLSLLILTGYLALVLLYTEARGDPRRRRVFGAAIVVVSLVWAQVHGSFVLAPVLFGLLLLPNIAGSTRPQLRGAALVFLGCLVALISSAVGLGVASYIGSHGSGDAVKYIAEMRPPDAGMFPDVVTSDGRAQTLLWLLGLAGIVRDGRVRWGEIACALLGLLLLSRAVRFAAEDALLTGPLAAHGARNVQLWTQSVFRPRARRLWALGMTALMCTLLARSAYAMRDVANGGFALGIGEDAMPELASRYLQRLPAGSNVLTAFNAGPMIGWRAQGRIRTFVDGRTPMYFHDTDYAVARDILSDPDALDLAIARWSLKAAVIDRDHGACDLLAKRWIPVVIEGRYTTFVPPGVDEPLRGVDPCGPAPFRLETCPDGGRELGRSIERMSRLGEVPMLALMRAAKELLCGGSLARAEHELDVAERQQYFPPPERRLRIRALLRARHADAALHLMRTALEAGDASVLQILTIPEANQFSVQQTRDLVELALVDLADDARPGLRLLLATTCMQQGDAECVRFEALRAAAKGARPALGPLGWLTQHHPDARVRADAAAWARVLASRPEVGSVPQAVPTAH